MVCRGALHNYFHSSPRGRPEFICLMAVRNHLLLHNCQTPPLAFFPGLLTWTVECMSQSSANIFLKNPETSAALYLDFACKESQTADPSQRSEHAATFLSRARVLRLSSPSVYRGKPSITATISSAHQSRQPVGLVVSRLDCSSSQHSLCLRVSLRNTLKVDTNTEEGKLFGQSS